jgi:hypothetical protein
MNLNSKLGKTTNESQNTPKGTVAARSYSITLHTLRNSIKVNVNALGKGYIKKAIRSSSIESNPLMLLSMRLPHPKA